MTNHGFQLNFRNALKNYTNEKAVIDRLGNDVVDHYTQASRHYHTLKHLEALTYELEEVRKNIAGWETTAFVMPIAEVSI